MQEHSTDLSDTPSASEEHSSSQGIKQAVREKSEMIVAKSDEYRQSAAERLDRAATAIRTRGDRTREVAQRAGERLEATAGYMRNHNLRDMVADCEVVVQRHPLESMIASVIFGFLLGRALRR